MPTDLREFQEIGDEMRERMALLVVVLLRVFGTECSSSWSPHWGSGRQINFDSRKTRAGVR